MLKSMTGFGKTECEISGVKISIEIKTLNSKQFDTTIRLPNSYKQKELEVRTLLLKKLERGKVELTLSLDQSESVESYSINKTLAKKYFQEIQSLAAELGVEPVEEIISTILKLPDVLIPEQHELDENEWKQILLSVDDAASKCDEYRIIEGYKLEADFRQRIGLIIGFLENIIHFEGERIDKIKAKFRKDLSDIIDEQKIDENRFEQEIIYYLEKIDITEEKLRLKNNCEYFLQALADNESNGKKLNFISQEIGREINTIGSKANDSNIQKLVVQMKDELEKVKEQLFNIL
jgi:uncharacterized protein (TIGR00255 family)